MDVNRTNANEKHADATQHATDARRERNGERTHQRGMRIARLRDAGRNLSARVGDQVRKQPHWYVGAAMGTGLVVGSIFGRRIGQAILAFGAGYFVRGIVGERFDIERLQAKLDELVREPRKD